MIDITSKQNIYRYANKKIYNYTQGQNNFNHLEKKKLFHLFQIVNK